MAEQIGPAAARTMPAGFRTLLAGCAIGLLALFATLYFRADDHLARTFFLTQDFWVLLALAAVLGALAWWTPSLRLPDWRPRRWQVLLGGVTLALLLWGGTYWVMFDYPLSRDEVMANFDAQTFAAGHLAAHLPIPWTGFGRALVPHFLLDTPGEVLLVSGYMPGNAMMRAAFGMLADPALMNPVLVAIGLYALWRIAERLFPESPQAVLVTLAAYLLSSQVLVTGMTSYAMTGHLVLNLVWLALFVQGRFVDHAFAMLLGAWTIGLHQVVFHPLFAAPFIFTLLLRRQWLLTVAYGMVYGAALLFWVRYPHMVTAQWGIHAASGSPGGVASYLQDKVWPLLSQHGPLTFPLMGYNVLRFIGWQAFFALPLVAAAGYALWQGEGLARPLAVGILLTLVAMTLLLPSQGHGWGYRYLHGLIGNLALLCGYGYRRLAAKDAARAGGLVAVLGAASLLIAVPWNMASAHDFVKPHARMGAWLARQDVDFLVVDTFPPFTIIDDVRNRADLSNRPVMVSAVALDHQGQGLRQLCAGGTVAIVTRKEMHRVGLGLELPDASPEFDPLVAAIRGRSCIKPMQP